MPKATVSQETFRYELETCPGGFVELRQLSYYEMIHRRDIAAKIFTEQKVQTGGRGRRQSQKPVEEIVRSELEIMNIAIMEFEFSNCIVNHNLEDDNGVQLDFKSAMAFKMLDPKIGSEIGRYIDELNQEDEESVAPLSDAHTSSSPASTTLRNDNIPDE
jgi:hypothetical protein